MNKGNYRNYSSFEVDYYHGGFEENVSRPFKLFCSRHSDLNVIIECSNVALNFTPDESVINWYSLLQGLVKSCNIKFDRTNWRDAKVDECKLFGRILTEVENRFFV